MIGTGDFNGDGHSDILWQNTSGQAAIWEMNGTNIIGGGNVAPTPGRLTRSRREGAVLRRSIVGLDCPDRRARRKRPEPAYNVLGEDHSIAAFVAPVQLSCWIGQPNSSGNPPELSNAGWDPFGLGDASHNWWNVKSGSVTFNLSGSAFNVVLGCPNDDNPLSSNYVVFLFGANGGGGLLGRCSYVGSVARSGRARRRDLPRQHTSALTIVGVPGRSFNAFLASGCVAI